MKLIYDSDKYKFSIGSLTDFAFFLPIKFDPLGKKLSQ